MKQFLSVNDVEDFDGLISKAIALKKAPLKSQGKDKTLGLIFFNPSLRTRLSTQRAATNLGMNVIVMNIGEEGWKLELEDGAMMDSGAQEHIKDAAKVMGLYCDILGVRSFAGLENRDEDYQERVLNAFVKHAGVPVSSLESATLHPLQSLADIITIQEAGIIRPCVVVSWANHPRRLPQAVVNSFLQWVKKTDAKITLTHPVGYGLKNEFINGINITHNQEEALEDADFVYVKNWSSYENYGECPQVKESWTLTEEKMSKTNNGKIMHCLPIRRNVIATDKVVDDSLVYRQAENRLWAAQAVLESILEGFV